MKIDKKLTELCNFLDDMGYKFGSVFAVKFFSIVGSLRKKSALNAASKLSSETDSPGCIDSDEKKSHALFAVFP